MAGTFLGCDRIVCADVVVFVGGETKEVVGRSFIVNGSFFGGCWRESTGKMLLEGEDRIKTEIAREKKSPGPADYFENGVLSNNTNALTDISLLFYCLPTSPLSRERGCCGSIIINKAHKEKWEKEICFCEMKERSSEETDLKCRQ